LTLDECFSTRSWHCLTDPAFYSWISRCSRLRTLYIRKPIIDFSSWGTLISSQSSRAVLSLLNITTFLLEMPMGHGCLLQDRHLKQILSMMPNLTNLSLYCGRLDEETPSRPNFPPPPFNLTSAVLEDFTDNGTEVDWAWILSTSQESLRSAQLQVSRSTWNFPESLFQAYYSIAPTLLRFVFAGDYWIRHPERVEPLLQRCTRAKEIIICHTERPIDPFILSLPRSLPHLRLLCFSGWVVGSACSHDRVIADHRQLEQYLVAGENGPLPSLKNLTLDVHGNNFHLPTEFDDSLERLERTCIRLAIEFSVIVFNNSDRW